MTPDAAQSFLATMLAHLTDICQATVKFLVSPEFWLQVMAIALSMALAYLFQRWLRRRLHRWYNLPSEGSLWLKPWHFLLGLISGVSFSLAAALLLSLCVNILIKSGLLGESSSGALIRLGYSIFYAWAIFVILLEVVRAMTSDAFNGSLLEQALKIAFWILAALHIVGLLQDAIAVLKTTPLPFGAESLTVWTAIIGLLTIAITLLVAHWLSGLIEVALRSNSSIDANLQVVLSRVCRFALLVFAVIMSLDFAGVDLSVLSVFSGALGVGVGFGLQKIASNYISGFIILLDRSVKIGDYVEVGAFSGVITNIHTRYSIIRNLAGEELEVPNETFVSNAIKNYSGTDRACVVNLQVSCAYESDVEKALELVMEAVTAEPRVLKAPAPWVIVTEFADSGINIKAGFWLSDPERGTGGLKSSMLRRLRKLFAENDIEIPYNKADLHLSGSIDMRAPAAQE